jgi:hypothetical protein
MVALALTVVAVAIVWSGFRIAREMRAMRDEAARGRTLAIVQLLAPGLESAQTDPRALLVWQPVARTLRQLLPAEYETLDAAAAGPFPFTPQQIEAAHARWTADWLAWERAHDSEYKVKAAVAEQEIAASGGTAASRARLDAIEREKLELYQRRYQDYVQIAKALQSLAGTANDARSPHHPDRPAR